MSIIYACTKNGLANRLRALIGYQALAHFLNAAFYVYWRPDKSCNVPFNSLFKNTNLNLIDDATFLQLKTDQTHHIYNDTFSIPVIWQEYAQKIVTWDIFRDKIYQLLLQLRPIQTIDDIVELFSREHTLSNLIGVHIRNTDNVIASETVWRSRPWFDPNKVSSIAGFVQYMQNAISHDPTIHFFVSTDHSGVERLLLDQFPNHILVYPKTYTHLLDWTTLGDNLKYLKSHHLIEERTSHIQDALIEMLLLGQCKMLVGTKFSSFSHFAALWGNIPLYWIEDQEVVASSHFSTIKQTMPDITIITGMHRSGTSMITQALQHCAISLGEPAHLMNESHPSNPDGHFEACPVVQLNNELLALANATWDMPPKHEIDWRLNQYLALLPKAHTILQSLFKGNNAPSINLAIKDSRFTFTLPFWLQLLQNTKIIICVRHPIEVALSLNARNQMSIDDGLHLWLEYNHRLLALPSDLQVMFTHYEQWMREPHLALRNTTEFLGLQPTEKQTHQALAVIKSHYRHHNYVEHNIHLSSDIIDCYQQLCEKTGEICYINYHTYAINLKQKLATDMVQVVDATQQALTYYRERVAQLEQELIKQRQQQA